MSVTTIHMRAWIRWARRYYWRYRLRLRHAHRTLLLGGKANVSPDIRAEEYVYIGAGSDIGPGVEIGRYTMLGPRVQILGNDHVYEVAGIPTIFAGRPAFKQTRIGRDVWVGANAVIRAGVCIGDGAIIGACALVVKDVDSFTVVGGVPARMLKRRFAESAQERRHAAMLDGPVLHGVYPVPLRADTE